MLRALCPVANKPPGYGAIDDKCLHLLGKSAIAVSFCSLNGNQRINSQHKIGSLKVNCVPGRTSFVCRAGSSGHRRNSDFSKQKHGFRRRDWQSKERDSYRNLDEPEILLSKNDPLRSLSNSRKFQVIAAPGPREKEIIQLFRKVQAQLRERAAVREDKKFEFSQQKGKDSETVDSLLKLLRKHPVDQGKLDNSSVRHMDLNVDQSNGNGSYIEDEIASTTSNGTAGNKVRFTRHMNSNRPVSNFRRKSPVPQVKYQPVLTGQETVNFDDTTNHVSLSSHLSSEPENTPGSEHDFEEETDSEFVADMHPGTHYQEIVVFDDLTEDESSVSDAGKDKQPGLGQEDFSGMKLTELRAVAKSHGVKGSLKLKKAELLELLGRILA